MRTLSLLTILTSFAHAQDFLHYKFDGNCSNEVINYANGPQALPQNGVLSSSSTLSPFQTGVFGGALAGGNISTSVGPVFHNRVTTGWNPSTQPVTGDLTMAWFMRQRNLPATSLAYLMGAPTGGFRLFTNGVGGTGLYQRVILASGGNGTNASIANDFFLPGTVFDVQAAAAQGWVHIAMVVDSAAQTAIWYANGQPVLTLNSVPGALINAAGPFMLGAYSTAATAGGSPYDLDEFVMSFRAYTPAEILLLSLAPKAGDGDYQSGTSTQCGTLVLGSSGGAPSFGNAAYGLDLTSSGPSVYALLFGFDRCTFGGILPLPMDAGILAPVATGCTLLTDQLATLSGVMASSSANLPFPIGASAGFAGLQFFSQAVALEVASGALSASNGFVLQVGW
ncbi:MAG: hypothetical protein JNK49_14470 [Planctomycetes bacterium]|nr:hypothetical protein [Planctomycetota bacterium]